MMFFGIYILVSSIFLLFSIINFSIWGISKKRKSDFFYGVFFLIMSFSYAIYSFTNGMLVGGDYALNYIGYVLDLLAGIIIIIVSAFNVKNNKDFFQNIFKK
jgi:hypothetical protein